MPASLLLEFCMQHKSIYNKMDHLYMTLFKQYVYAFYEVLLITIL